MIFSVYSVKMVLLFPTNLILPFYQKSKDDLLPRNILTMTFLVSLKKTILILENMVFLLTEILKMIKQFTQSNMYRENKCNNVNNISNKFVTINFPFIILKNLRSTISIFTLRLFTEEIDTTAVPQLIYNFCLHRKLKMFCKPNNSKWCYVKNYHLF